MQRRVIINCTSFGKKLVFRAEARCAMAMATSHAVFASVTSDGPAPLATEGSASVVFCPDLQSNAPVGRKPLFGLHGFVPNFRFSATYLV